MATRTITVHDRCTNEGCGAVLHSILAGERGLCPSCWFKSIPPDKKKAMNRLIAAAFDGALEAEKGAAVDAVLKSLTKKEDQ